MTNKIIDLLAKVYKALFVWLGIILLFIELVGGIILSAKFGVSFFLTIGTLVGTLLVWCSMSLLFKIVSSLQNIESAVCEHSASDSAERNESATNE